MALKINNKFKHEETVYLLCDTEQTPRMVIDIVLYPGLQLGYRIAANGESTEHYEFELVAEKQVI